MVPSEGAGLITWASNSGKFCLGELKAGRRQDSMYGAAHVTGLEASRSLALLPGETVLQVPRYQLACPVRTPLLHCRMRSGKLLLSWTGQAKLLAAVPVWEISSINVTLPCF